jgi:hypothetical protein
LLARRFKIELPTANIDFARHFLGEVEAVLTTRNFKEGVRVWQAFAADMQHIGRRSTNGNRSPTRYKLLLKDFLSLSDRYLENLRAHGWRRLSLWRAISPMP